MENMVNSDTDNNLKAVLILSTLMQHLYISIVDNVEQLPLTQATFPNLGVKPKVLAGFGQVVPIKANGD